MPLDTPLTNPQTLEDQLSLLKAQYPEGLEVTLNHFNFETNSYDSSTRLTLDPPTDIYLYDSKQYFRDPRDPSSYFQSRSVSAASIEDTLT